MLVIYGIVPHLRRIYCICTVLMKLKEITIFGKKRYCLNFLKTSFRRIGISFRSSKLKRLPNFLLNLFNACAFQ